MPAIPRDADRARLPARALVLPAAVIGFALSGFFDGILLHQVLQWHHLLSLVPGEPFQRIGVQILADGLFHVLMYAIAAVGLALLWRRRGAADAPGAGRQAAGGALFGFGLWNIVDVGFFHWTLGIHRIRIGVENPLAYDIGWIVPLGLVPLLIGWRMLRSTDDRGGGRRAAAALVALPLVAGPLAALPSGDAGGAVVLFRPGLPAGAALNAIVAADARVLRMDGDGRWALVALGERAGTARLYAGGALLVSSSPAVAGCLGWSVVAGPGVDSASIDRRRTWTSDDLPTRGAATIPRT